MSTLSTATPPAAPADRIAAASPWIYRPWIDLLVGCGAWSAPLLLLAFFAASAHARAWTLGFYFLALLSNYPHFMATIYRAYHTHSEFAKYRIFTVHIALLLAATGIVAHLWYPLLPVIFTLYICWSPWHYTGQNFGLLMMFARRSGLAPSPNERLALRLGFLASFIMLMLSFHTGASSDPLILSLGLAAKFTLPARIALAVFFMAATGWAFASLLRRASLRAILPPLLLAVTQFLWFLLPAIIELATSRDIPQTRYSSGILAVLHSTQYLWITSYYQSREARAAGNAGWKLWKYWLTLVAGGIALFIPGPWLVSRLGHFDFAASFLTFTALVNIHHFILDGALWKLRDTRISALLLNTTSRESRDLAALPNRFMLAMRWFAGDSSAARAVRVAAVVALFAVAAIDQLHFYWSTRGENAALLQRAALLNPDDSTVQLRLARAAAADGNREAEVAALRRAAKVNLGDLNIQESLARGLIEAGRNQEAYAQYRDMLLRWPNNTNALVNYGLLAHRLGNEGEAVDSWQRAIAVDPMQSRAQLYVAEALEQQGDIQAAARHYRIYLQLAAAHPAEHRDDAHELLTVLIKVADSDTAANRADEAGKGYAEAARFAAKAKENGLESLALVRLADLKEKSGDAAEAAREYQRALVLDANSADQQGVAADWLNYAQLLRHHGQSERLVFACLLHAEELLSGYSSDERAAIVQARSESATRLGRAEAAKVLAAKSAVAQEALSLSPVQLSAQP